MENGKWQIGHAGRPEIAGEGSYAMSLEKTTQ